MKRYATVDTQRKEPRQRCCAKCKTPFNCGNAGCTCHHPDVPYWLRKAKTR